MPSRSAARPFALMTALTMLLQVLPLGSSAIGATGDPWINEIHYDNAGADTGEAIEVAGPAGTDLSGWSVVLYNGSNGTSYATVGLSGIIPDQQDGFGTITEPALGMQNGSPDGVALVDGSTVVQFLSYEGTLTATTGPATGLTSSDIGIAEAGSEPAGQSLQLRGSGTTYGDFDWTGPTTASFGSPNAGQSFGVDVNPPVVADCGRGLAVVQGYGGSGRVSATDEDGTVTSLEITTITPSSAEIALTDLTPAGAPGGTATATVVVDPTTEIGTYLVTILASNDDASPQTDTCELTVTVEPVLTVGAVNGQTTDDEDGTADVNDYNGQTVTVRGVVTQRLRLPTSSGGQNYAFFLQSTTAGADGDPLTSDGLYVFMNRFTSLLREGSGSYFPTVGDQVVLRGPMTEYFNLTELNNPRVVAVERTGVPQSELTITEANPPDDLADANRYWERHEGMLFHLDAGALVTGPRDVFASTYDAEAWVIRGDHPIAQRGDPYARRVFRDPHPLDDIGPAGSFDNGNGMRILLTSHGLKWLTSSNLTLIAPARTFDTVTNALTGGLTYTFGKYGIEVEQQPSLSQGVDPALNAPPSAAVEGAEYATSDYNVENLYDFRDDPFDGCDFLGNSGCPGVSPPFDYVPLSQTAYDQHLADLAAQIAGPMHAPDILMIQEAEDQDICSIVAGAMSCGTTDDADGQPDTLQDLALAISAAGGPTYVTAYDRDGADDRGIVAAFMYRTDHVELLPVTSGDPVLNATTVIDYRGTALAFNGEVSNPKAVNADLPGNVDTSTGTDGSNVYTRAPQVGHFRVWRDGIATSVFTDLWAVSNHFSSGPDGRVGQRTEQAAYNAAIFGAIIAADPDARFVSAGDFNVFPRPDDPFAPDDPLFGADQLGPLYEAGLHNLYDTLLAQVPSSAYSYTFAGMAQTLDMQFANDTLFDELVQVRAAHLNADFAADDDGDVARGASDHDPQIARWSKEVTAERLGDLVGYFVSIGEIDPTKAAQLEGRMSRAAELLAAGKTAAYRAQLRAFVNQVDGLSPRWISDEASAVLQAETERLAGL